MSYGGELASCEQPPSAVVGLPIRDKLMKAKAQLEKQIADIDRALELYEKNPDIEELTNLVRNLHY